MNKLILILFLLSLFIGQASASESVVSNNFSVTWYDCNYDLTQSSCTVDIQNLNATINREFNLSVLISSTNYNLNSYTTSATIKEWKILPTEVPIYETILINGTNQTIQNGTKLMNLTGWKSTKSNMLKESLKQKLYYGRINIPKYGSKAKVDDNNNTETINGIKTFMIEWTTPIIKTDAGWGSSGLIAFIDEISGDIYHPWWDTSWNYSVNNAIPDGSRPYQISLNISNSTGINNATHIFCNGHCNVNFTDIRFTLDNATALPYWIEDNITGKVWVNIAANGAVNMYYGNPSATTSSNGKNTFIFFNDTQKTVGVSEIWTDVGFNLIGDYIIRGKYSATTDDGTIYIADGVSVTGANIYYTPSTGNTRYYDGTFHNIVTTNLNNPLLFEQHMTSTLVHDITVYNSNYQYVGSVTGVAYRDSPTNIHTVFSASDPINTYYILVRKYVLPDIVWATWGTEQLGDFIPPSYSSASHNQSIAGLPTLFSIQYNDETALHPNGQWIFATNNTGEWVNESAVNWIAAPEWANVTKTLNSTVGTVVGYRWYANDNAGNVNNTPIYSLTVTSPPAPIIISWGNNFSNNESLSFTIEMFQNILFNSTANQTLTLWTWTTANQINGSNQNVSFASYNFTIAGIKTVSVYGNNGNGITQTKTWTINVNNTYPEIIPFSMTQSQYDAIISHSDNAGVMGFIGGIIGGAIVIGVLRRKDRR